MKYWETFFLTSGAGLFVGMVITPSSWLAAPFAIMCTLIGYTIHRWQQEDK